MPGLSRLSMYFFFHRLVSSRLVTFRFHFFLFFFLLFHLAFFFFFFFSFFISAFPLTPLLSWFPSEISRRKTFCTAPRTANLMFICVYLCGRECACVSLAASASIRRTVCCVYCCFWLEHHLNATRRLADAAQNEKESGDGSDNISLSLFAEE